VDKVLRIHSMELKGGRAPQAVSNWGTYSESIQWNWKGIVESWAVPSKEVTGIHSMELKGTPYCRGYACLRIHRNPFNGIESNSGNELYLSSPGCESIQWNWKLLP
jgi:hypothetical protein